MLGVWFTRPQNEFSLVVNKCMVPVCVDVLDITEIRDKLKDVGPVDLLVNIAGVSTLQSFLEVTPEDYDKWVGR